MRKANYIVIGVCTFCFYLHRFTGMAASPLTRLARPRRSLSLALCTRCATSTRCGTRRPLAGGCSSTRHGASCRARLSSLALRMRTFIGVTYGFLSHFLPGRGTSAYGNSSSCGSLPPCRHCAHALRGRKCLTSGSALPRTTRRAKSPAGGISSNTLSSARMHRRLEAEPKAGRSQGAMEACSAMALALEWQEWPPRRRGGAQWSGP